jgi:hypothetical protein
MLPNCLPSIISNIWQMSFDHVSHSKVHDTKLLVGYKMIDCHTVN